MSESYELLAVAVDKLQLKLCPVSAKFHFGNRLPETPLPAGFRADIFRPTSLRKRFIILKPNDMAPDTKLSFEKYASATTVLQIDKNCLTSRGCIFRTSLEAESRKCLLKGIQSNDFL